MEGCTAGSVVLYVVVLIVNFRNSISDPDPCAGATCPAASTCKSVALCSPACAVISVCATHAYKSFEANPCRVGTPVLTSFGREVTCSVGGPPCPGGLVCLKGKRNIQGRCCHRGGQTPAQVVKRGTCPTPNFYICFNFCTKDLDCKGNHKCCFNGCGRACVKPEGVDSLKEESTTPRLKNIETINNNPSQENISVPPSTCPKVAGFGSCVQECRFHSECRYGDRCCSNGCGYTCQTPVLPPKNGKCPMDYSNDPCFREDLCKHDSDCNDRFKCCFTNCGKRCIDPNRVQEQRPGHCPDIRPDTGSRFSCTVHFDVCQADTQCPSKLKCCETGCGKKCQKAVFYVEKAKVGQCPHPADNPSGGGSRLCVGFCVTDSDCPITQKCCMKSDGCSKICTNTI